MREADNNLHNAEIAFSNKQYSEALKWYEKVLEETPDDLYVLSRAGSICVPLGKFEDALMYFNRARELDPDNGDTAFNYANACFFNKDNVAAFSSYVEAEKLGCSEDVVPKLYFQLALICSMRQDVRSALIYIRKCEESDKSGIISLNPDLISEKIKLYMIQQDYENAEKCAAQFVAVQPSEFKNYMVYFGILMAHKKYDEAEKVLNDAQEYATLSNDDSFAVLLQLASLNVSKGMEDKERTNEYCDQAIALLIEGYEKKELRPEQAVQLLLAMSETYLKMEDYEKSIHCLRIILSEGMANKVQSTSESDLNRDHELTPEEIEAMILSDMDAIREKINTGEMDGNLGLYSEVSYDEEGRKINLYSEEAFRSLNNEPPKKQTEVKPANSLRGFELPLEMREKVYFTLLSAYMGKEDYSEAEKYAKILKHSNNKYYSYFGLYTEALITRKKSLNTYEIRKKYDEAIAFFRSKTFSEPGDSLAVIFRARLYAEDGKFEKAKELALLLSEEDRKAVLNYIETCRP